LNEDVEQEILSEVVELVDANKDEFFSRDH
jgi:hypothetical protein